MYIFIILDSSSVIFTNASSLGKFKIAFNLLIEDVQDFHIKKDFMFATRKVLNNTQLFISYKRGRFVKADFQTELDIKVSYYFTKINLSIIKINNII